MTNVLEAPETTQEEQRQPSLEAAPRVAPVPRRPFWQSFRAKLAAFVSGTRQRPDQDYYIVDARKPELQAVDRLVRDFPHLYIHSSCG